MTEHAREPDPGRPELRAAPAIPRPRDERAQIVAQLSRAGNRAVARALGGRAERPGAAPGRRVLMRVFTYTNQAFAKQIAVPAVVGGPAPPPLTLTGDRPQQVQGPLHPVAVPARGRTATPLAYVQTPAAGGPASINRLIGYDGGHVVGLHLGGENVGDNVVPMFPLFNRGPWKNMEDSVKRHIARNPGTYRMSVTMTYAAAGDEVPTRLDVVVDVEGPPGTWTNIRTSAHNQPTDIVRTTALLPAQQQVVNPAAGAPGPAAITMFHFSGDDFETNGLGLTAYVNANGHMPRSKRAHYPDNPAARPYGLLDVLSLNGALGTQGLMTAAVGMSAFRDFSADQRKLILQTNMAKHGGALVSDDPTDPQQNLDERGAANAPEVDHIVPKSLGGSNYFSNARLVSWQLNNREARVKPLAGIVDLGRLATPALTGTTDEKAEKIVEQAFARRTGGAHLTVAGIWDWAAQTWSLPQTLGMANRMRNAIRAELEALVTDGKLTSAGNTYTIV